MRIALAFIVSVIPSIIHAQNLSIRVPDSLHFVEINGKATAYYEIVLTNFYADSIQIKSLEVLNTSGSSLLLYPNGKSLLDRQSKIGSKITDSTTTMPLGSSSIFYMELALINETNTEIVHHVTFDSPDKLVHKEESMLTFCSFGNPLILGKPLNFGLWTAIYDPSWVRGHRRVVYIVNGKARIPGRYAIDFIRVDDEGKIASGDENIMSNWLGHGADVLAVADGIVATVRDGFPESRTLSDHPAYSSEEAAGNYISIKIGDNQFAFYEHLKPKNIQVKPGQKVKRGDVIGSLGLTGQGTSPHLHFHIANVNSLLGAEGIPFVFEEFEVIGFYPDFGKFGESPWEPLDDTRNTSRYRERPSPNTVIKFTTN